MRGRFPVLHRNARLCEPYADKERNNASCSLELAHSDRILCHARPGCDKDFLLPVVPDRPHDPQAVPAWPLAFRIGFAQHFDRVALLGKRPKALFGGHVEFEVSRLVHLAAAKNKDAFLLLESTGGRNHIFSAIYKVEGWIAPPLPDDSAEFT